MENIDATAASDTALPDATPEMGADAPEIATESAGEANTPEGAVDAAFAKLDAKDTSEGFSETPVDEPVDAEAEQEAQPEGEPEAVEAQDEWGEAPARLSEAAKASWNDTPAEVRADIHRTIQEMESGIQQYQQDFEPYKALDQALKAGQQDPAEVIGYYTGMEDLLRQDPVTGFHQIADNLGMDIYAMAEHILNQQQGINEGPTYQDQLLQQQSQQIHQLSEQLNGVQQQFADTQQQEAQQMVAEFAKTHPRLDELSNDISAMLSNGMAATLEEAYEKADRLNPSPNAQPAPKPEPKAAQTRKQGSLSVDGSPAGGSNPIPMSKSTTPEQSVDRAMRAAGL